MDKGCISCGCQTVARYKTTDIFYTLATGTVWKPPAEKATSILFVNNGTVTAYVSGFPIGVGRSLSLNRDIMADNETPYVISFDTGGTNRLDVIYTVVGSIYAEPVKACNPTAKK